MKIINALVAYFLYFFAPKTLMRRSFIGTLLHFNIRLPSEANDEIVSYLYDIYEKNKKIDKSFSIFYKFNQKIIASLRLEKGKDKNDLFIFKLNLTLFLKELIKPKVKRIQEISKYPIIKKDLSFVCNKDINLYKLKEDILKTFPFIKSLEYFDLYMSDRGVKIGLHLKFQSFNKTLTNIEIDQEILNIIEYLIQKYNLSLT